MIYLIIPLRRLNGLILSGFSFYMSAEKTFLEEQDGNNAGRNGGIRDVEHRAEENEIVSAFERDPFRQVAFIDGKVEHIYHFTV